MPRPVLPLARRAATGVLLGALVVTGLTAITAADGPAASASTSQAGRAAKAKKVNVVTPGDFTGYGFDQCQAPSQTSMNRWLRSSPYLAVGIYIAGNSRAC